MNLGDKIALAAQPIAKGIDAVLGTDLQNCGGCKKMQADLNSGMDLSDAFYDRFWPKDNNQQKDE